MSQHTFTYLYFQGGAEVNQGRFQVTCSCGWTHDLGSSAKDALGLENSHKLDVLLELLDPDREPQGSQHCDACHGVLCSGDPCNYRAPGWCHQHEALKARAREAKAALEGKHAPIQAAEAKV